MKKIVTNKNDISRAQIGKQSRLKSSWLFLALPMITSTMIVTAPLSAQQQRSQEHQNYCLKLEAELARSLHGGEVAHNRNKVKADLRNIERTYHRLENEAERYRCYNQFLFSKELRRTPRCIRLHKKIRRAKNQLSRLNQQLHRYADRQSDERYKQNKIIQALARNQCGRHYEREARKRNSFSNWFDDSFFGGAPERYESPQDRFQFSTHRTVCVRLCDGYFFPISFATTTNRFATDEGACQARCSAPARLFTYPNPGGSSEQMMSIDGIPYNDIKNAWRFKKEFVKGCSCKVSEYNPALLEAKKQETSPESENKETKGQKQADEKKETLNKKQSDDKHQPTRKQSALRETLTTQN